MIDWSAERTRFERVAGQQVPEMDLGADLFGPQLAFVDDEATFVDAVCSRRAGKSHGAGARLLRSATRKPRAPVLYFTLTRKDAKRIMWQPLIEMNERYRLGFEPIESELVFKKQGVARIYLTGCDNQTEIGKMRGSGWGDVVGDEAQLFPQYIQPLVEEVITPALMDFDGSLRLLGTPAPVPNGYFYDSSRGPTWSHHHWTCWDNPHVNPRKVLDKALALRGISEEHPSIQREFFGRWVYDPDALVFKWAGARNVYRALPDLRARWEYVIGVDLGFDDSDAMAVLAFNPDVPHVYLVEEWIESKQTISQLAERLGEAVKKYDPNAMVMDTGGLGKKIAEEIRKRFSLPIKAAEKQRKFEFIELLNDSLRSGRFFAKSNSRFADDAMKVEWDKDRSRNDHLVISERFHSDICDAVLYAYRESLHWLHEPKPEPVATGTSAWQAEQEREMREQAMREVEDRMQARREEEMHYGAEVWG